MIRLHHAEALRWLKSKDHTKNQWDMIFADPPDNIGLNYDYPEDSKFGDDRLLVDYYNWLELLILESMFHSKVIWVSYYWKHDLEIKFFVREMLRKIKGSYEARTFLWNFNFGQYRETDCCNQYRPILRLSRRDVKWHFPEEVRIESERMRLNDPRARGLKVPGDVWEFPRIQGNNSERRSWCPTQHPEGLLERMVRMSKGQRVLELFTGSGSMIRVAKRLGFDLDTVELNSRYIDHLTKEHKNLEVIR